MSRITITVEGPVRSGKTMLARFIAGMLRAVGLRHVEVVDSDLNSQAGTVLPALEAISENYILVVTRQIPETKG